MDFADLGRRLLGDNSEEESIVKPPSLSESIAEAKRDLLHAQHYYNQVTDDELIEHAIYLIKASEKRYTYLLKKARDEKVADIPYGN